MSTSLLRVVERAQREPEGRFHSLAHLIDVPALERAFHRLRTDAAVGVDGVSKAEYEQALEANLEDLHGRLRTKRYRHPMRRFRMDNAGRPRGRLRRASRRDARTSRRACPRATRARCRNPYQPAYASVWTKATLRRPMDYTPHVGLRDEHRREDQPRPLDDGCLPLVECQPQPCGCTRPADGTASIERPRGSVRSRWRHPPQELPYALGPSHRDTGSVRDGPGRVPRGSRSPPVHRRNAPPEQEQGFA